MGARGEEEVKSDFQRGGEGPLGVKSRGTRGEVH